MFDPFETDDAGLSEKQGFDLLRELEQNKSEEIRRKRRHFRLTLRAGVTLQPGNASDLVKLKLKGVTGDVSEGGLSALFALPVGVGDMYRLEFDRAALDLPLTFTRCLRCRLVREGAYECGFAFFSPISLPENVSVKSGG